MRRDNAQSAANVRLMRNVAEAFAQADLKPLFEAIAPDIVWKSASTTEGPLLFGGTYLNRLGVVEVTSLISAAYAFSQFTPKELLSSGDTVWGLFSVTGEYFPPGRRSLPKMLQFDCAIRWRLRDGKVVEHQAFFDTLAMLRRQDEQPSP